MNDGLLNKQQRKKARRKERKQKERAAHRSLDAVTSDAVAEALRLAPSVVDAKPPADDHVIDVELASLSEAEFVRKRVNDALKVGEWLDDVSIWIWQADVHVRPALSERGEAAGLELRIERVAAQ